MKLWAPSNEFILRSCFGKEAFEFLHQAKQAAKRINQGPRRLRPVTPYRCQCCHAFHIGGARKPKMREIR